MYVPNLSLAVWSWDVVVLLNSVHGVIYGGRGSGCQSNVRVVNMQ